MTASATHRPLNRWHWLLPALVLAAGTCIVWIGDLDRLAAAAFYVPGDPTGWPIGTAQPWRFLYRWAVMPGILLGAGGLLAYAWGELRPAGRPWRRAGLTIVLSLALGPLLLVNGVLHETWGRPRPRQVAEFGGTKTFRPVLVPAWDRQAQSFPTGHAAAGFAVMALYFVWRERRPGWARGALGAGLALGGVTAVARMAQGGHWLSDGLWSGGIVYFSAWAVAKALADDSPRLNETLPPRPYRAALAAGGAVALCAGYLASLPLLERIDRELPLPPGVHELVLELSAPAGSFPAAEVHTLAAPGPGVRVTVTWTGRSGPVARLEDRWDAAPAQPGRLAGRYTVAVTGYRKRQTLELWVAAPPDVRVTVWREPSAGSAAP
ncbi:MAG: phosphatase PAP2 family protein [SAR324 cluster bacterium]